MGPLNSFHLNNAAAGVLLLCAEDALCRSRKLLGALFLAQKRKRSVCVGQNIYIVRNKSGGLRENRLFWTFLIKMPSHEPFYSRQPRILLFTILRHTASTSVKCVKVGQSMCQGRCEKKLNVKHHYLIFFRSAAPMLLSGKHELRNYCDFGHPY